MDEIRIEFTGSRPGEKLYEGLLADADDRLPTVVAHLRVARLGEQPRGELTGVLHRVATPADLDPADARRALRTLVTEYRPAS